MLAERMIWMKHSERLKDEIIQCRYEGKDVQELESEVQVVLNLEEGEDKERLADAVYKKLQKIPVCPDFPFQEPQTYDDIRQILPKEALDIFPFQKQTYPEHLRGAWYGRAIGCLLGIPVEGWSRARILGYLKESGQYPLDGYIRSDAEQPVRQKYQIMDLDPNHSYDRRVICWKNNITSFPVDDDLNYLIAAMKLLEDFGRDFSSENVMENWLISFPFLHSCTAERVACQNAVNLIPISATATVYNPYREWIGAQIRGDFFGYINPGNPAEAASMAYRDAAVSHTKNGIYGEMFIAALISLSALREMDMPQLCRKALQQIPQTSRLYQDVLMIVEHFEKGDSYEKLEKMIYQKYDPDQSFDWCYVNPNTMICVAAVLCYEKSFGEAIAHAVTTGFDTDCNGATVGSILGMRGGFGAIEEKWLKDLEPVLHSSISGYEKIELEEAVARTMKLL